MNNPLKNIAASEGLPQEPTSILDLRMFSSAQDVSRAEIAHIAKQLMAADAHSPRIRYPESKFRKYFAPFFLGIYDVPEGTAVINLWISETGAGSHHTEVDIIDTDGKVLFTVPPLINSNALSLAANQAADIRFAGLQNVLMAEKANDPQGAKNRYIQGVGSKLSTLFDNYKLDPGHQSKWGAMAAYYGVGGDQQAQATQAQKAPLSSSNKGMWDGVEEPDFG